MGRYMVVALTNPVEGREDEYNDWYENVALPCYRGIPNMTILGRHKLVEDLPEHLAAFQSASRWKYASFYIHETDDIDAQFAMVNEYIAKAKAEGRYYLSDAIDEQTMFEPIYEEM